jgi:hypothetical protein
MNHVIAVFSFLASYNYQMFELQSNMKVNTSDCSNNRMYEGSGSADTNNPGREMAPGCRRTSSPSIALGRAGGSARAGLIGMCGILVPAISDQAERFYGRCRFGPSPFVPVGLDHHGTAAAGKVLEPPATPSGDG